MYTMYCGRHRVADDVKVANASLATSIASAFLPGGKVGLRTESLAVNWTSIVQYPSQEGEDLISRSTIRRRAPKTSLHASG